MFGEFGGQETGRQAPRGVIDVIMGRFVIRPFRRITTEDVYQAESRFPREGVVPELTTQQKLQQLGIPAQATRFVRQDIETPKVV